MKYELVLLLTLFFFACNNSESESPKPIETITKGDLTIPVFDYAGLAPLLHQANDTTYVINFWATWCVPCVAELPFFEQIQANFEAEKVKVILVSLDFRNKLEQSLIPFLKKNKLKSQVILLDDNDANTWIGKVSPDWSGALPATIIYNQKQRTFFEKSFTFGELEEELLKIKNLQP